jgi:hypothetical protein
VINNLSYRWLPIQVQETYLVAVTIAETRLVGVIVVKGVEVLVSVIDILSAFVLVDVKTLETDVVPISV